MKKTLESMNNSKFQLTDTEQKNVVGGVDYSHEYSTTYTHDSDGNVSNHVDVKIYDICIDTAIM
ncbi:MAG: hypothetical protein AAF620_08140 [Bacteroidota bacterium]